MGSESGLINFGSRPGIIHVKRIRIKTIVCIICKIYINKAIIGYSPANIALPTLTIVAPSSMAILKSFVIPIDICCALYAVPS